MASFQHTASFDSLTVGNIFIRGINNNNNIPAFNVLSADGAGGTMWVPLSTIAFGGGAFRSVKTSVGTYTSDISAATFSLLDGPNVGLINDPTASNTVRMYAKAFGNFDISGGNSISCYDPDTNVVNSNVLLVGTGGISIKGDPQTNTLFFDGRELPFVSTLPYSFNQLLVYSNVPLDTLKPSTFSSIILQAQGPSSILSFAGEDLLKIETNYATNLVTFRLSTLTSGFVSSLVTNQRILLSTYVQKAELSTFSTTYGQLISFQNLQANLCSMSTSILTLINRNSTNIGDVSVYSKGISSVWRGYLTDRYTLAYATQTQIQSTSFSFTSSITDINNYLHQGYNVLKGSTIQTPLFWTSTLVSQTATSNSTLNAIPAIGPLNVTLYPTYDSVYNVFGDTQPFGSPLAPTIYTANMDVTKNMQISSISSVSGIIFSTMFAIQGSFSFLPNDDAHPFNIDWRGNLALSINGSNFTTSTTVAYPRLETFTNTTITNTIVGAPICQVSFTYLKQSASDYISFSNMNDYIYGTDSFKVARMYQAYGYNTKDTPLISQSISRFPIGFSTFSNTGPYLALSSYVLVASTFYTSGCNTMFPIRSLGFNSISFKETLTGNTAVTYAQNLATNYTDSLSTTMSASNTFGYDYTTSIPNSPYILELVYGKCQPLEFLYLSSLYKHNISYDYAYATYVSSLLYASTISSYNGYFVNLNIQNLNITNLTISTLSSVNASFSNIDVSTINNLNIANIGGSGTDACTISTLYTNINLLTSSLTGNTDSFSTVWTHPQELYTSTLYASSITLASIRQPFIQYGSGLINPTGTGIPLPISYLDTYAIQLTYSNITQPINALFASNVNPSSFYVKGDIGNRFYWTTFGSIF